LVAGAVVPEISASFDTYWNNEISYPGGEMHSRPRPDALDRVRRLFAEDMEEERELLAKTPYPIEMSDWSPKLRDLASTMHYGTAIVLLDQPLPNADGSEFRLVDALANTGVPTEERRLITSPYLIPVEGMIDDLRELKADGVDV
jgi:putative cardiolipin synthase